MDWLDHLPSGFVLWPICSAQVRRGTDSLRRVVRSLFRFAPPVLAAVRRGPQSLSVAARPLTSAELFFKDHDHLIEKCETLNSDGTKTHLYLSSSRCVRPLPRGFTGHVARPARSIRIRIHEEKR